MTIILTDKQKSLFQEDKYVLVDTIIILENKLKKAQEELRFTKNELLLEGEAHIKAQEEMDALEASSDTIRNLKAREKEENKTVNKAIQDIEKQLDKAWDGEISSENFVSTVTRIITGDYYSDKESKKRVSND